MYKRQTYANLGSSTAGANDTWATNNSDRILYGELTANYAAGDHTASLTAIATADAKLDTGIVSLAKRLAEQADPHIRPIRTTEDEEYFVMFCDPYAFRDLSIDTAMTAANRDARERGTNNPLFAAGDLLWDGVIIRKIPEIATFIDGSSGTNGKWGGLATADGLNTAEAASGRVGVNFLCGQQALSYGMGQRPKTVVDKLHDYEFQPGVAVELKEDVQKSYFNNKQHGMVTVFTASATD